VAEKMSHVRPQEQQQQQFHPHSSGVVSVDRLWNIGIAVCLVSLIALVGVLMVRGFVRYAVYKWNIALQAWTRSSTTRFASKKKKKEEEEDEDDDDDDEDEEVVVTKVGKRRGSGKR
jgi:hypothetical protein